MLVNFRLHRIMLTILTDVRGVCLSVCLSVTRLKSAAAARAVYAVCAGSFGATFVKILWPLVCFCQTHFHRKKYPYTCLAALQCWSTEVCTVCDDDKTVMLCLSYSLDNLQFSLSCRCLEETVKVKNCYAKEICHFISAFTDFFTVPVFVVCFPSNCNFRILSVDCMYGVCIRDMISVNGCAQHTR